MSRSKSFARYLSYHTATDSGLGYEELTKEERATAVKVVAVHDGTAASGFTVTVQATSADASMLTRYLLDLPGKPLISPVRRTKAGRFTCLVQSQF